VCYFRLCVFETEGGELGLRRGCQWTGNSPATAMKNYALVRKTNFVNAGEVARKSDAVQASMVEQKPNKKRTAENDRSLQCV